MDMNKGRWSLPQVIDDPMGKTWSQHGIYLLNPVDGATDMSTSASTAR